jgi:hypothetical protein
MLMPEPKVITPWEAKYATAKAINACTPQTSPSFRERHAVRN